MSCTTATYTYIHCTYISYHCILHYVCFYLHLLNFCICFVLHWICSAPIFAFRSIACLSCTCKLAFIHQICLKHNYVAYITFKTTTSQLSWFLDFQCVQQATKSCKFINQQSSNIIGGNILGSCGVVGYQLTIPCAERP